MKDMRILTLSSQFVFLLIPAFSKTLPCQKLLSTSRWKFMYVYVYKCALTADSRWPLTDENRNSAVSRFEQLLFD